MPIEMDTRPRAGDSLRTSADRLEAHMLDSLRNWMANGGFDASEQEARMTLFTEGWTIRYLAVLSPEERSAFLARVHQIATETTRAIQA